MAKSSYSTCAKVANLKYSAANYLKNNKGKIIFIVCIILVGLFTGIFTAIKFYDKGILTIDYLLDSYVSDKMHTFESFLSRVLSAELMLAVIFVSSLTIYTIPFGVFVLVYRSYLIAFNCSILVILFGLSGILTTLFIVFPCQLVIIVVMGLYSCVCIGICLYKKKYSNSCNKTNPFVLFLIFSLVVIVLIALETLLLAIFSSSAVLTI